MNASGDAFQKQARLLTPKDFSHVFRHAKKLNGTRPFTVLVAKQQHVDQDTCDSSLSGAPADSCPSLYPSARLGLAISKKHARRAVDRNRIKRIIRESFRAVRSQLPGIDVVVLIQPGAIKRSSAELRKSLAVGWQHVIESEISPFSKPDSVGSEK